MLDTGILVAALITRDTPPDQLYQLWRKRRFTLITSEPQLSEFRRGSGRAQSPAPSMARERLCWAPWTGPTNGRRVSRVMSYLCTPPTRSAVPRCPGAASSCSARSRPYTARRWLTWSGTFRARLRNRTRMLLPNCEGTVNSRCSSDSRSGSRIADGLPAHDVPVAGRELHASRGGRDGATGGGRCSSGVRPREVPGGCGGGEAEGWKRRNDRALGPTRSSR